MPEVSMMSTELIYASRARAITTAEGDDHHRRCAASPGLTSGVKRQLCSTFPAGYYYVDLQSNTQGPFCIAQLHAWKADLPADLQIWHTDGRTSSGYKLCELIEDYEHADAPDRAGHTPEISNQAEELSYAEIALAALPEDDETRQLAKLAAESGTTLQELAAFCHGASGLSEPVPETQILDACDNTANLDSIEQQPQQNWRKLKKLKQQRKQHNRNAWLYS